MNLSAMTTCELQERLYETWNKPPLVRTEDEDRRQVEAMPLEVLLMHAEYIRRNMQPLRTKQLVTYEDAAKHIVIPELLRRLQMAEAATLAALRNVGVDTECGSCMSVAMTGATVYEHTCQRKDLPELRIEVAP